ncbi:MAG: cysteine--tRNA ligase [candidate division WOR-3 bacterium]
MKLFNTATGKKEDFVPVNEGRVGIYACGMTLQSEPHMGHMRTFVSFDTARRYLSYKGYQVIFVSNFTDIDDKIIEKARERGIDWREIARENELKYERGARAMNLLLPTHQPRATQHIQEIIELAEKLLIGGHAYETCGNVWFRVRSFRDYGKLSGKPLDELIDGARVEPDPSKEDPADFALWKAAKPGEPYWHSPWGKGRPGWHIECSAMSAHYLGQPFDIHGGGADLIFPHHENEKAQSEAAEGVQFAKYWLHCGLLQIGGEKMSKSTGKYFALDAALADFDPMALRLYFLKHHYRSPLNFTEEALRDASSAWDNLRGAFAGARSIPDIREFSPQVAERIRAFGEAMDDDLNTPRALAECFGLASEAKSSSGAEKGERIAALAMLLSVLGFRIENEGVSALAEDLLSLIIDLRAELRAKKDFVLSDSIRNRLSGLGITLEDTPAGTVWHL